MNNRQELAAAEALQAIRAAAPAIVQRLVDIASGEVKAHSDQLKAARVLLAKLPAAELARLVEAHR